MRNLSLRVVLKIMKPSKVTQLENDKMRTLIRLVNYVYVIPCNLNMYVKHLGVPDTYKFSVSVGCCCY